VYGEGSGFECRQHVQHLNLLRKDMDEHQQTLTSFDGGSCMKHNTDLAVYVDVDECQSQVTNYIPYLDIFVVFQHFHCLTVCAVLDFYNPVLRRSVSFYYSAICPWHIHITNVQVIVLDWSILFKKYMLLIDILHSADRLRIHEVQKIYTVVNVIYWTVCHHLFPEDNAFLYIQTSCTAVLAQMTFGLPLR